MIAQSAPVEAPQQRERMLTHPRQNGITRAVEQLEWRDVRCEVPVADQLLDRLVIAHQDPRLQLIPQPVRVPYAVGAAQRATLDVVQAQARLAVLHHLPGALRQRLDLLSRKQWNESAHASLPWLILIGRA